MAKGLNMVHSIPIIGCPFKRTLDLQIKLVQERINNGLVHEENFDVIRKGRTVQNLFEELVATRPISEDVVFTHGDYCLPNIIIKGTEISCFVDLGYG